MTDKNAELDQLLAGLGATRPAVSDALMARILADAAAVQNAAQTDRTSGRQPSSVVQRSHWGRIAMALGGGKVIAGLGSAALAGVVLGFAQPAPIATLSSTVWDQQLDISVDLLPAADDLLAEG